MIHTRALRRRYVKLLKLLVLRERIELSTSPLPMECSTTELPQLCSALATFRGSLRRGRGACATGAPYAQAARRCFRDFRARVARRGGLRARHRPCWCCAGPPKSLKGAVARRPGLRTKGFALARQDGRDTLSQSDSPISGGAKGAQDIRAERLAAALRENLRRRKAQARSRRAESGDGGKIAGDGEV